jgi:hypothetical protein
MQGRSFPRAGLAGPVPGPMHLQVGHNNFIYAFTLNAYEKNVCHNLKMENTLRSIAADSRTLALF